MIGPGGGEWVRRHRVLAELPELEVLDLTFAPDFEGVAPHTHPDHVDSFYVLEGEAEFVFGDDVVRAARARSWPRRPGSCTASAMSAPATSAC